MSIYLGHKINGLPVFNRKAFELVCQKYDRFVVEVRNYTKEEEITLQQMRWLHCKEGPIQVLSQYQGVSLMEAQRELKRKCGRQWFVEMVDETNYHEVEGQVFFECKKSFCNKLFHPVLLAGRQRLCPYCQTDSIQLINIKSKTSLTVRQTNLWFMEIFEFMESIGQPVMPPDPRWNERK